MMKDARPAKPLKVSIAAASAKMNWVVRRFVPAVTPTTRAARPLTNTVSLSPTPSRRAAARSSATSHRVWGGRPVSNAGGPPKPSGA